MKEKRYLAIKNDIGTVYEVTGILNKIGLTGTYSLLVYRDDSDVLQTEREKNRCVIPNGFFPKENHTFLEITEKFN